ncbi:unnamed protein product [Brassica napus]|nr:unnamed protein product [Brassica napus]
MEKTKNTSLVMKLILKSVMDAIMRRLEMNQSLLSKVSPGPLVDGMKNTHQSNTLGQDQAVHGQIMVGKRRTSCMRITTLESREGSKLWTCPI